MTKPKLFSVVRLSATEVSSDSETTAKTAQINADDASLEFMIRSQYRISHIGWVGSTPVGRRVVKGGLFSVGFRAILYKISRIGVCSSDDMQSESISNAGNWCEPLYEKKAAQLVLYGRALGLSHSEAEDVLQDTFIALMRVATVPKDPEFYCIAAFRNRALNYRRGLFRRIAREFESLRWFDQPDADEEDSMQAAAVKALQTLPQEQREAIVLKIWHEYTFEQMGQLLQISPNTVAGRYRYGMSKLRAVLGKEQYEGIRQSREPITLMETAPAVAIR